MAREGYVSEAEDRKMKRSIRAPCVYTAWNNILKQETEFYPAVWCEHDCAHCGWNPLVAEARLAKIRARLEGGKK